VRKLAERLGTAANKGDEMHWMLLPLKRYAEFSGRSRRKEYWMFVLFQILVSILLTVLIIALGGAAILGSSDPTALAAAGGGVALVGGLYFLFSIAMFIPSLAVGVRRLHDTNRTGWWMLAPLLPYLVLIFGAFGASDASGGGAIAGLAIVAGLAVLVLGITLLVFLLLDGTRGPNRYGADPKGGASADIFE
jgi:uncharacterized membrane protein YhaH (DUF805 family)